MSKKLLERIEALERRVAELEARPIAHEETEAERCLMLWGNQLYIDGKMETFTDAELRHLYDLLRGRFEKAGK